jgi:cephalosporin hydroxylase
MAPITKTIPRNIRWLLGRSDSDLSPSAVHTIQQGALAYTYKGIRTVKDPFDLALYMLLLWREKARTIIEIGTCMGGSALWLADQLETFGIDGMVHTLDLESVEMPRHRRIALYQGDAKNVEKIFPREWLEKQPRPIFIIDDGSHVYEDVLAVLRHFGPLMTSGEYIAVEDGMVRDMRSSHKFNGGPTRAINEFLAGGAPFEVDRQLCDFFGRNVTWNVDGFLRKI